MKRRDILKIGVLGGGLTLSQMLAVEAQDRESQRNSSLKYPRSAILVFLKGGPSHQDTFDLKPNAEVEYRGQFQPIATSVDGIRICEHLPLLARIADKFAIVRGVTHNLAAHSLGTRYLMTGNRPTPVVQYPTFGSVVSKELPGPAELPNFVSIDRPVEGPGYLGAEYGPLSTGEKPRFGQPFRVRGISLSDNLTIEKYRDRKNLLKDIDTAFRGFERLDESVRGLDRFSDQAFEMISSPRARDAFNLSAEKSTEIRRFGQHEIGQSLLLTSRLIEAGVRFVTVLIEDWDTHQDNFNTLGRELLPNFDRAMSALLERLEIRGLLSSTAVLVTGEFGRTPKINKNAGRDHWAQAMVSLMAGGDIIGGRVLGKTDSRGAEPDGEGYSPDDLAATFFRNIGIDPKTEYSADVGRPITLIRDGRVLSDLFA